VGFRLKILFYSVDIKHCLKNSFEQLDSSKEMDTIPAKFAFPAALLLGVSAVAVAISRHRFRKGSPLYLTDLSREIRRNSRFADCVVAHRGFHYASAIPLLSDETRRPLENTLPAYERAWAAGVKHCECDVALTKDGEVILCHDDDLKRLALSPGKSSKNVKDCLFEAELEFFPLKDGSRVPRLVEVLSAAKRVGGGSKLVIEIKGDDRECARKVADILSSDLGEFVAIVMGFSLVSVSEFAKLNPRRGKILSMLLAVKGNRPNRYSLNLEDTASLEKVLKENAIDGLYLQYNSAFLKSTVFAQLCQRVPIGVWGRYFHDIDDAVTASQLLSQGAKFVNSDFPDGFFNQ